MSGSKNPMHGKLYTGGIARCSQGMGELLEAQREFDFTRKSIAQVYQVHSDAMTCDIITNNGYKMKNVPILSKCGLIDDKIWGEIDLPCVDEYVVVEFIEDRASFPYITGTLYPYSNSKYQSDQTPVNSDNKQFTLKLLEKDLDTKVYRRIFQSGTSIEVQKDGTLVLETPDGTFVMMDATNSIIHVEDLNGNIVEISGDGISVTDANGNEIMMTNNGVEIDDCKGNKIVMASSSVKINNNLEVLQ